MGVAVITIPEDQKDLGRARCGQVMRLKCSGWSATEEGQGQAV